MSTTSAPAELHTRRPIRARLGLRSRMKAFVVNQTVSLLKQRDVTPGGLRAGAKGVVIALEGDGAWVEFELGRIKHKELIKLGQVALVYCSVCGTTTTKHVAGCALDMASREMDDPQLPGLEPGRF